MPTKTSAGGRGASRRRTMPDAEKPSKTRSPTRRPIRLPSKPPTGSTGDEAGAAPGPFPVREAGAAVRKRKPAPKAISLVLKVLRTIDGELMKLEQHTGKSSQDRERASRALSQMVTSLEKTVDMQRQIARDKNASSGTRDKEAMRTADDMRRRIAERVERLARDHRAPRACRGG